MTLRPEDITKYSLLGSMKFSPDGTRAILSNSHADLESNGYNTCLYLLDAEGEKLTQLTHENNVGSYSWYGNDTVIFTSAGTKEDRDWVSKGEIRTVIYAVNVADGKESILARVPFKGAAVEGLADGRILLSTFHDNRRPDFESMPEAERRESSA